MAITQITTRDTMLEKQRLGFDATMLELDGSTLKVSIGSIIECGGSLFVVDTATETPTGTAQDGAYLYFDGTEFSWSTSAGAYSAAKGAVYNGTTDRRCRFVLNSLTTFKMLPAVGLGSVEKLTGSGNWTVPAYVYSVKVTMSGGGGGGGGGAGATGAGVAGTSGDDTTMTGVTTASGGDGGDMGAGPSSPTNRNGTDGQEVATNHDGMMPGAIGGKGGEFAVSAGNPGDPGHDGLPGLVVIERLATTPGESIAYACGEGGAGGTGGTGTYTGGDGSDGANGWIILEY